MPIIQLHINAKFVIHPGSCFVWAAVDAAGTHTNITVNRGAGPSTYHAAAMANAVLYVSNGDFAALDASPLPSPQDHQLEYNGPPSPPPPGTYPLVSYKYVPFPWQGILNTIYF